MLNKTYKTNFIDLVSSMFFLLICMQLITAAFDSINYETPIYDISPFIEHREQEQKRNKLLEALSFCESSNRTHAIGDNGDSVGYFQYQKPTLEDILGYEMSYEEYYSIATNYKQIKAITYEVIFEDNEEWRWVTCWDKIN